MGECQWSDSMAKQKFTVFLIPDTEGYQAVIPHFGEAITFGQTPQEAFANAKEGELYT